MVQAPAVSLEPHLGELESKDPKGHTPHSSISISSGSADEEMISPDSKMTEMRIQRGSRKERTE